MHRTTIQLEGPLEVQLKRLAHEERRSLKDVINEILRRGLEAVKGARRAVDSFQWHTVAAKPAPFFDPADRDTYLKMLDEGF